MIAGRFTAPFARNREEIRFPKRRYAVLRARGPRFHLPEIRRNIRQHPGTVGIDRDSSIQDADRAVLIQLRQTRGAEENERSES